MSIKQNFFRLNEILSFDVDINKRRKYFSFSPSKPSSSSSSLLLNIMAHGKLLSAVKIKMCSGDGGRIIPRLFPQHLSQAIPSQAEPVFVLNFYCDHSLRIMRKVIPSMFAHEKVCWGWKVEKWRNLEGAFLVRERWKKNEKKRRKKAKREKLYFNFNTGRKRGGNFFVI